MSRRSSLLWRLLAALTLMSCVLGGQVVGAGSASAGQVGVTTYIRGAGTVSIVEGSIEDDGPRWCVRNHNQDDRVTDECPRVRNSEPFEAWVWLRAEPSPTPADNWVFDGWTGCHETREVDGFVECGVHSGAFNSVEATPTARFVDVRAPELSDVEVRQHQTLERTSSIHFTDDAPFTECQFDGNGTWVHCVSGSLHEFKEGEHRVDVRAVDQSGHSVVKTAFFDIVDTAIVSGPEQLTNSTSATFTFASGHAEDYVCRLDGGAEWPCASGRTPTTTLTGLRGGLHELLVRARHGAAIDKVPAKRQWRVDTVPAETAVTGFETTADGARITFQGEDAASFECRLTSKGEVGGWQECSSPHEVRDLPDGDHRLEVRGVDLAGNADPTPEARSWRLDRGPAQQPTEPDGPPQTSIASGPENDAIVLDRTTVLTYEADESAQAWQCQLDGKPLVCGAAGVTLGDLAPGTHTFGVAAVDSAGHVDATPATRTFTVPAPATAMKGTKGFRMRKTAQAWAGVAARTTRRGARLSYGVSDARSIALVLTTSKRGGTISVTAAGRKQTIRLTSPSTQRHHVVRLPAFAGPWSGTVRLKVKSDKRPVLVEGIAVATR